MLDTLFPELGAKDFLGKYWPKEAFWNNRSAISTDLLQCWAKQLSIEQLLKDWVYSVHVWSNDGSKICDAHEAGFLYESGCALYVPRIDRIHVGLKKYIEELEAELEVPPGSGHCSIFAAKAGATVQPHCDHDYGFNINIIGKKHWSISSEQIIEFPLIGHQLGRQCDALLADIISQPLPSTMPTSSHFTTIPGAVVFLPPGVWHSTVAKADSLSLDFAIDPPRRSSYLTSSLEKIFNSYAPFRAPIDRSTPAWVENIGLPLLRRIKKIMNKRDGKPIYIPLLEGAIFLVEFEGDYAGYNVFVYADNREIASFRIFDGLVQALLSYVKSSPNILSPYQVMQFVNNQV